MDKFQKSHIVKLTLLALLFFITPLLSSSMRPPYLYFLLNLLIIVLGAEAGFLSFLKPLDEKNPGVVAPNPIVITSEVIETSPNKVVATATTNIPVTSPDKVVAEITPVRKMKRVKKTVSEKIVWVSEVHNKIAKCPSMPSLFFIGGGEGDADDTEEEVEGDILTGQELFSKAETFIGNFYKQLKIQREDSWKKIHGLYNKAF